MVTLSTAASERDGVNAWWRHATPTEVVAWALASEGSPERQPTHGLPQPQGEGKRGWWCHATPTEVIAEALAL